jgi:hypothetical protein
MSIRIEEEKLNNDGQGSPCVMHESRERTRARAQVRLFRSIESWRGSGVNLIMNSIKEKKYPIFSNALSFRKSCPCPCPRAFPILEIRIEQSLFTLSILVKKIFFRLDIFNVSDQWLRKK